MRAAGRPWLRAVATCALSPLSSSTGKAPGERAAAPAPPLALPAPAPAASLSTSRWKKRATSCSTAVQAEHHVNTNSVPDTQG